MSKKTVVLRASRLDIDGPVVTFSHQSPATRNAMSPDLQRDYVELCQQVRDDRSLRALIITGSQGSFCAGGNVKQMHERLQSQDKALNSPDATRRRLEDAQLWLAQLRELDIPVIAAVNGPAYGAGFGLALQADFILASTKASFCMSFARVGALPDYGAFFTLPRIVGLNNAKDLMLTARRVDAAEAKSLGLVQHIHAPDVLLSQAVDFARRLARGPVEAISLTRKLLNKSFENDYATMAQFEALAQAICMSTDYHVQAAARFSEGKSAQYDWDRDTQATSQ